LAKPGCWFMEASRSLNSTRRCSSITALIMKVDCGVMARSMAVGLLSRSGVSLAGTQGKVEDAGFSPPDFPQIDTGLNLAYFIPDFFGKKGCAGIINHDGFPAIHPARVLVHLGDNKGHAEGGYLIDQDAVFPVRREQVEDLALPSK